MEKINILLVDDRADGLLALEAVLTHPGYRIVKANSGAEALKCVLRDDFALILMDVQMPVMNGFETAALIRERERSRSIPIIFITAINTDDHYVWKGYQAGAVDYLFKPFHPEILRSKVAVFVELFRKSEQVRKQAELLRDRESARFLNLAEQMPQMIWHTHENGTTWINERWAQYTGIPVSDLQKTHCESVIHPEDWARNYPIWLKCVADGTPYSAQSRIRGKDGQYRWFLVEAQPASAGDGGVQWIGITTDVQVFRDLDEQRANFLSIASHELKTPLTSIKTTLQIRQKALLGQKKLDPDAEKTLLEIALKSSNRLNELLDDLLDFSRVQSGILTVAPKLSDLAEAMRDSVVSNAGLAEATGRLKLEARIPRRLPGVWDTARLRQVADNLIGNAIKYTPGKGTIRVNLAAENGEAVFSVEDEGIGIPPEHQDRIFGAFERAVEGGRFSGFGIGLYVSKRIVEQHRGQISVRSSPGTGSVFTVRIPMMSGE